MSLTRLYAVPQQIGAETSWRTRGGYGNISKADDGRGKANAARERIWFSPHCLRPGLFGWAEDAAPEDIRTLPPDSEGG